MDDLVVRLRQSRHYTNAATRLCLEAANELEIFRDEIFRLRHELAVCNGDYLRERNLVEQFRRCDHPDCPYRVEMGDTCDACSKQVQTP